jgi:hypothetical protein
MGQKTLGGGSKHVEKMGVRLGGMIIANYKD